MRCGGILASALIAGVCLFTALQAGTARAAEAPSACVAAC